MGLSMPVMDVPGLFAANDLLAYLNNLGLTLHCKFNEASGNLVNYGSDGGTGTVSGCTQGQTGQLGANEAYLFDGVDDRCYFANAAVPATAALTSQAWVFLVNPSSLGEGDQGIFFSWGNMGAGENCMLFLSTNRLNAVVSLNTTSAQSITNNNQVDFLNTWTLVFMDYDDTNALGLGRRIRFLRATAASAATLLTLGTNTAGVGTITPQTSVFNIGTTTATMRTFAGLKDFVGVKAGLWSPAGAPTDLTVPNKIRSLVFNV